MLGPGQRKEEGTGEDEGRIAFSPSSFSRTILRCHALTDERRLGKAGTSYRTT